MPDNEQLATTLCWIMRGGSMSGDYYIANTSGHFELFRTKKPRFRADVDLNGPHPELKNIRWLDQEITKEECDLIISEAVEYLELLVLMGE